MRKKTQEEYIEDLYKVNPHLHLKSDYINSRTKVSVEDDRCHHTWEVSPNSPLRGIGCPYCSQRHKRTYEEFIKDLKEVNPNIIILTSKQDYVNGSTKVLCKCNIDGCEWWSLPSFLLRGGGCPKCYGYITEEEFRVKLFQTNPNIILYGKYLGSKVKTQFKCLIDGSIWEAQPYHILHGNGCPTCANRRQSERQIISHEEYLNRLKKITNDIIPVEQYIMHDVPILHKCLKCGHEWKISPNKLITERQGCPVCNSTKGENRIIKFLQDYNINFVFQMKFDDLKYKSNLYYDFYIPYLNTLIEYDGEFHYFDIFKNGSFETSLIRDELKNKYAISNNIDLIRIPYWDFNNIESILTQKLLSKIKEDN